MLNLLKSFFENNNQDQIDNSNEILELLCGLMIEAANTDGKIDDTEINKIETSLKETFKEDTQAISISLKNAIDNKDNSKSLFHYTSKINKEFSDDKKVQLIQTLWEIVLSDGEIHDYESNLIRRLSGLLYISDVISGNARKRALDKIKKD